MTGMAAVLILAQFWIIAYVWSAVRKQDRMRAAAAREAHLQQVLIEWLKEAGC